MNSKQRNKDKTQRHLIEQGRKADSIAEQLAASQSKNIAYEAMIADMRLDIERLRTKAGEVAARAENAVSSASVASVALAEALKTLEVKDAHIIVLENALKVLDAKVASLQEDAVDVPRLRKRLQKQNEELAALKYAHAAETRAAVVEEHIQSDLTDIAQKFINKGAR